MHILIVLFQIQRTIVFQKTSDECIDSCFDNILHLIIIKYWKTCIVASHAYCLVVESSEKKEYLFKIKRNNTFLNDITYFAQILTIKPVVYRRVCI